jgi:hypothetical protein
VMLSYLSIQLWMRNDALPVARLHEATEQPPEDSLDTTTKPPEELQLGPSARPSMASSNGSTQRGRAKDHKRASLSLVRVSLDDYVTLRGEGEASTSKPRSIEFRNCMTLVFWIPLEDR